MKGFKMIFVLGLFMAVAGCAQSDTTAPSLEKRVVRANLEVCDYDASRTGYFVRSGSHWTDNGCTP